MAALPALRSLSTKAEQNKKLQRPRPLRTSSSQSRLSAEFSSHNDHLQELMMLVEAVSQNILKEQYSDKLTNNNIPSMCARLKQNGPQLESIYKDQLDRAFKIFRDGCQNENLLCTTRLHLLELVELRANHWSDSDKTQFYYSAKMAASELEHTVTTPEANSTTIPMSSSPTPPLLGPGEVLKTSGKFSKPTKIPNKNYCKDEVVIRNSDSGKVMGIKGRRVHMIEELSETIISFQRVNPGAKERLVQITGPTEEKINHARHLMKETILRNASPTREGGERDQMGGSNSSLNSSASDESSRLQGTRHRLHHSLSTNDATSDGYYRYTVTLGNDSIKIMGKNCQTVTNARLVLEEYYNIWLQRNYSGDNFGLDEDVFIDSAAIPDIGMLHLNALDPGNGKPHPMSSSGDSDDVTCVSSVTPPGVPLDHGLVYPPLLPPVTTPERRATLGSLGRSNSIPLSPLSMENAHTRKYSREFLLSCSSSKHSHVTPLDWDSISERFPSIVKKVYNPYYACEYPYNLPPFPSYLYSDGWTYVNPYAFPN